MDLALQMSYLIALALAILGFTIGGILWLLDERRRSGA
jgi:hypothetical protein